MISSDPVQIPGSRVPALTASLGSSLTSQHQYTYLHQAVLLLEQREHIHLTVGTNVNVLTVHVLCSWSPSPEVSCLCCPAISCSIGEGLLIFLCCCKTPFTFIIDVWGKGCLESTDDFWVPACLTMPTGSIGSVSAMVTAYTTSFWSPWILSCHLPR